MALEPAVQGAKRPSQQITWADEEGTVLDLTGATITARIRDGAGSTVDSDGTFVLVDAPNGVFRWDYGTTDVAEEGDYKVQFTASFGLAPSPARNFTARWQVTEAL